jgi:hypothetical protein
MAKSLIPMKPEPSDHIQFTVRRSTKNKHKEFAEFCKEKGVDFVQLMSNELSELFSELKEDIEKNELAKSRANGLTNGATIVDSSR